MTSPEQNTSDQFDFSQYLVLEPDEIADDQLTQDATEQFDFSKFMVEEEPSFVDTAFEAGKEAFRFGARNTATALSAIGGIPGNTVQFAKWISSKLPDVPDYLKGDENFVTELGRETLNSLPTSEDIKEFASNLTNGFTDPQNALEEFGDDVLDLGATLAVGNKDPTKAKNLVKLLSKATAAKGVRVGSEKLGASPGVSTAAEIGTLLLMSLADQKFASKYASEKFGAARSKILPGQMMSTNTLNAELGEIEKELEKGISTASKNDVKAAVKELQVKAAGGAMPAEEVIQAYQDINERMTAKKLFDDLSKGERKQLNRRYNSFRKSVQNSINDFGKDNPEFIKEWKEANEAFGTIKQSKKISNWSQSIIGRVPKPLATGLAYSLFNPQAAAISGAGVAGSVGALKTGELMYRIAKSPVLRKHYTNVMNAAIAENQQVFIKNLGKLEEELQKDFTDDFYSK